MMPHLLLVEDDPILGAGIKMNLEMEKYHISWARDLRTARELAQQSPPDLVLLDLGLPDGNGLTYCKELRDNGSRLPIVILTAQADEDSVVAGLSAGANDYVRKPFGNRELIARIKTALRAPPTREEQVRFGNILVLRDQRRVMIDQHAIDLNRREFDIFNYLVNHGNSVVSRENLLQFLDREGEILDRTLDSHISHIRSKLKTANVDSVSIASVYGIGYRLEKR
jgi:two-component system, OmpR family, response regulator